jgi:hypothetical protein
MKNMQKTEIKDGLEDWQNKEWFYFLCFPHMVVNFILILKHRTIGKTQNKNKAVTQQPGDSVLTLVFGYARIM